MPFWFLSVFFFTQGNKHLLRCHSMWNKLLEHYKSCHCLVDAKEQAKKYTGSITSRASPSQSKESKKYIGSITSRASPSQSKESTFSSTTHKKDSTSLRDRRKTDGKSATGHTAGRGTDYSTSMDHSSNSGAAIKTKEEKQGGPLQTEEDEDGFTQVRSRRQRRRDRPPPHNDNAGRDQECQYYMRSVGSSLTSDYIKDILRQEGIDVRSVEILNSRRCDSPGNAAKITVGKGSERKLRSAWGMQLPAGVYIHEWRQRSGVRAATFNRR